MFSYDEQIGRILYIQYCQENDRGLEFYGIKIPKYCYTCLLKLESDWLTYLCSF